MLQECLSSDQQCEFIVTADNAQPKNENQLCLGVKEKITNLAYNLKHNSLISIPYIQRRPISIRKDQSRAFLLGQKFDSNNVDAFNTRFQNTIWMSYRNGIQKIQGDVGWGCTIRAMQMLFAQILKRHLNLKTEEVLKLFSEDLSSPFSLLNICGIGCIEKRWTGIIEIFSVMRTILKQSTDYNLIVDIFNDTVSIPDLTNIPIFSDEKTKTGRIIVVTTRFDSRFIPVEYYPHFFHLMKSQYFCGAIGGVRGQALYLLGHYDDQIIFLDPHYVQNADKLTSSSYFRKTPRGIPISDLSPEIAYTYYLKDNQQYIDWASWIINSKALFLEHLVIDIQVQNPQSWLAKLRKASDDDFQILF